MRELMISSVELPGAYAAAASIDGMTVGGKTGTAELLEAEPHSWFTGFAQVGQRSVVVAVVVEHGGPGSQAALPIGRALLEAALVGE
jgi:cell division protein FtsI/penicillin-binding protein 2